MGKITAPDGTAIERFVVGFSGEHSKLCDYPLRGARAGKTCDAKLCSAHATAVGERARERAERRRRG